MSGTGAPGLGLAVSAHMRPTTVIRSQVYGAERRAVLSLEGGGYLDVALFGRRPELVRLRDVLDAVIAELDEQRAAHGGAGEESAA